MAYEKKNFDSLLGLKGFSDALLKNHFSLYEGYVANVEKISDALAEMVKGDKSASPEFAELKRRFGWEWNGMRLHEYYFGNLTKEASGRDQSPALLGQMKKDFGTFENWEKDFRASGAMRGIGWVILYFDTAVQKLFNVWVNEHDAGHLAGGVPILVMDVFEHAFVLDYGTKKADYIAVFMNRVDWKVIGDRFDWATRIKDVKPESLDHLGCRC